MARYFFISVYILSLLLALVLFITGKNRGRLFLKTVVILHLAAAAWLAVALFRDSATRGYALLTFLCTGLAGAGWLLRSPAPRALRAYFGLFFLTLLFFIYSPSRFASFLEHADLADRSPRRFRLHLNYYLEQQPPTAVHPVRFKLIQQFGLFHKTLQRDISLPGIPDSVIAGTPGANKQIDARVYTRSGDSTLTTDLHLSLSSGSRDPSPQPSKQ